MLQRLDIREEAWPPTLVSDATEVASILVVALCQPVAAARDSSCSRSCWAKSHAARVISLKAARGDSVLLSKWLGVFDRGRCRWSHIRVLQCSKCKAQFSRNPHRLFTAFCGTMRGSGRPPNSGRRSLTISIRDSKICGFRAAVHCTSPEHREIEKAHLQRPPLSNEHILSTVDKTFYKLPEFPWTYQS